MIRVVLLGHALAGPAADVLRLFAQGPVTTRVREGDGVLLEAEGPDGLSETICSRLASEGAAYRLETFSEGVGPRLRADLARPTGCSGVDGRLPVPVRREIRRQLHSVLSERTGIRPPWGSLTGIRPTVLAEELLSSGLDGGAAAAELADRFGVSPDRAGLAVQVARAEAETLALVPEDAPHVYVSIPFCTSRCAYCSFPSGTLDRWRDLLPDYLDALLEEAGRAGARMRAAGQAADGLYVGGGTPAVLSASQTDRLLRTLRERIPFRDGAESTFEAGRCDDLDEEKLGAIAGAGIRRICLNPQSTDPKTLARIGRPDPGRLLARWTERARRLGISCVSMDLIAGLPGEGEESFRRSLDDVLALRPENLTVHALSRKRAAPLSADREALRAIGGAAAAMADHARGRLEDAGYAPYYLYRQKDIAAGLENVGWTLPGFACRYNVAMMSDRRTIVGLGAGATSKTVGPDRRTAVRSVRPLDPATYLARIASEGGGR